ncbi:MAG: ribosome rescue protein RqcH [Ignisphaera sp.]
MPQQDAASIQKHQKNSMSWLDISVWINEQKSRIENAYIDNIYIYSKNLAILKLRRGGEIKPWYLIIEPGKRISLSDSKVDVDHSKNLTSVWRTHIRDCKIISVDQHDRERIIVMKIACGEEERRLIIELLPRGTVVLTDSDYSVVIALEYKRMKDRIIVPKSKYVFPPKQWQDNIEITKILEGLRESDEKKRNVISYIVKTFGFPPEVVEAGAFLCEKSVDNKDESIEGIIKCIIDNTKSIIDQAIKKPTPCIVYVNNIPLGFYPFVPPQFTTSNIYKVEVSQSFNDTINRFFIYNIENLIKDTKIKPIMDRIEKLRHTLQEMNSILKTYEDKKDFISKIVSIIEENYPEIESLHQCVQTVVKQYGWKQISKCSNRIVGYDQSKGLYYIDIGGIRIELNVRKPLVSLYNEYRKALSDVSESIERTITEMQRIEGEIKRLSEETVAEEKSIKFSISRKMEWFEKFHWTITPSGFLILGGRDASQNIYLIKKLLKDSDIVMHADIHGGSAVIIKTDNRQVDEETLREAAVLAASYSKAWKLGLHTINVFWVLGSQVSLSPPSGEYLPRGGFMVYGKKNFIDNVELRIAIGIEILETDEGRCIARIIVGSEATVSKKGIWYMVLQPGDLRIEEVVEKFRSELKRSGLDVVAKAIDLNELRSKIPGRSKIVKMAINENAREVLKKCLEHLT